MAWAAIAICACSDDNNEAATPAITVDTDTENLVLESGKNSILNVDFSSESNWRAEVDAEWLTVTPKSGKGGEHVTVSVIAKENNLTGEERQAQLMLGSGGRTLEMTVRQKAADVLEVAQTLYEVSAEGGDVTIEFSTSFVDQRAQLMVHGDVSDWIEGKKDADMNTKALVHDSYILTVLPNETRNARSAQFNIYMVDKEDPDVVLMQSPTITINQLGQKVGTSEDLETYDKQVVKLQDHSTGRGIPVVLMGDGFIDTELADGTYRRVMEKALDNLFTEEPLRSMRQYFDVWMVTAVSLNNAFGSNYSTKFGSSLNSEVSTEIKGDNALVKEYVKLVSELGQDPALLDETLAIVILNTEEYAGTTYISFASEAQPDKTGEFAIAYCPIVDGLESERYRQILCHEGIGHGFGKLLDEYSYEQNGTISSYYVDNYRKMQEMGWAMNVDFSNDPATVMWSRLLADPRYQGADAFGQILGIYEGGCGYIGGVWRPTEDSMMHHNQFGFNVPSREALYKRVMSTAYGEDWTYNYDEFTTFDQAHLPQPTAADASTRGVQEYVALPAPRIVNTPSGLARRK